MVAQPRGRSVIGVDRNANAGHCFLRRSLMRIVPGATAAGNEMVRRARGADRGRPRRRDAVRRPGGLPSWSLRVGAAPRRLRAGLIPRYPGSAFRAPAGPLRRRWLALPPPDPCVDGRAPGGDRSEEHTSELQSLMRISYAVVCLKNKT